MKKRLLFFILFILSVSILLAQNTQGKVEEKGNVEKKSENVDIKVPVDLHRVEAQVTIQADTDFNDALLIIEELSRKYEGKKIVNMTSIQGPIGIPIKQLNWRLALQMLLKVNNLKMEVLPGAYIIKPQITMDEIKKKAEEEKKLKATTKQVKISAIFFKADKSITKSLGIDWSTLVHGNVTANVAFSGGKLSDQVMQAAVSTRFDNGAVSIDLNTLLNIIESNQKGAIIAHPNVTVMSGKKGYIQVGQDFSTKTKDQAGNVSDQFFSTGLILEVKPTVMDLDGKEVIHLVAKVEKSSATPGQVSTIINKSQSNTELILFDGEETVIGGLYDTEETSVRVGIPILKDLPWWVFGIKYLTGYNKKEVQKNEMIVIIKAKIMDPIQERQNQLISTKEKINERDRSFKRVKSLFKF
jgi:type IV pilus assembly protein PilQ